MSSYHRRFDGRSVDKFTEDIKFGTDMETFWMQIWVKEMKLWPEFELLSVGDYGTDNSGGLVAKPTSNADYYIKYRRHTEFYEHPLEVKWAPTSGKATFKIKDLHAYIKQNSAILLIFNTHKDTLKQVAKTSIYTHQDRILGYLPYIKWAMIHPEGIRRILNDHTHEPIPYMGHKMGLIVDPVDFHKYMVVRELRIRREEIESK
jgi:hypothetical protein